MSEYIKKEDAITGLKALWDKIHEEDCLIDPDCKYGIDESIKAINNLPSADVVEVRHGHWECEEVQCIFGKKFILTCSECGKSVSVTEEALPEEHYCRSCGARMDGDKE